MYESSKNLRNKQLTYISERKMNCQTPAAALPLPLLFLRKSDSFLKIFWLCHGMQDTGS